MKVVGCNRHGAHKSSKVSRSFVYKSVDFTVLVSSKLQYQKYEVVLGVEVGVGVGVSILSCRLAGIEIHIIKIRRSDDDLIFIMEIWIPRKTIIMLRQDPGHFPEHHRPSGNTQGSLDMYVVHFKMIIALNSPVRGCPICILWGGGPGRIWAQSG